MLKVIKQESLDKTSVKGLDVEHHLSTPVNPNKKLGPLHVINHEILFQDFSYLEHEHRDIEIISYVYHGILTHEDTLNEELEVPQNHVQFLRAGSGIKHRESNFEEEPLLMVQLWIEPKHLHLEPSYEVVPVLREQRLNNTTKIVSGPDQDGLIKVDQDINVFVIELDEDHQKHFTLKGSKELYMIVLQGSAQVVDNDLKPGDAIHTDEAITIKPKTHLQVLLIEIF